MMYKMRPFLEKYQVDQTNIFTFMDDLVVDVIKKMLIFISLSCKKCFIKVKKKKVWSLQNLENADFLGWLILEVIQNYFSTLFVKIFSWENVYFIENLNFYWLYSISGLAFVSPKVDFTNGGFFLVWVMWKDLSAQPILLAYHFFTTNISPVLAKESRSQNIENSWETNTKGPPQSLEKPQTLWAKTT